MIKVWGILDITYFTYYLIGYGLSSRVPFLWDWQTAQSTAVSYGNHLPIYLTTVSLLLLASMPISAWVLLKNKFNYIWLVYLQTPIRLFWVMPSVFFIGWLFPSPRGQLLTYTLWGIVFIIESYKIYTIYRVTKKT